MARIGDEVITADEFLVAYEFGHGHLKTGENPRREVLDLMIREELLAQEAERMDPVALLWEKDYEEGIRLSVSDNMDSLETALRLLSRSVKSFPDSWLARDAHKKRGEILEKLGRREDAKTAWLRVREFYKNVSEVQLKFPD